MENRWSDEKAAQFAAEYAEACGEDLAIGLYVSALIGAEEDLVLHGGGNSSVKTRRRNVFGERTSVIYVKASGRNMACADPTSYTGLDLEYLRRLRILEKLSDDEMVNEFRTHSIDAHAATPSIETLVHVFLPGKFIEHTHPDAILALSNQQGSESILKEALGPDVILLGYAPPGFRLAKAVADAAERNPHARAMVLMQHGLVTWGESAHEAYDLTIELANRAEQFLNQRGRNPLSCRVATPISLAEERFSHVAPMIRGLLSPRTGDPDRPWQRIVLKPLITRNALHFVDSDRGKEVALTPPLTSDHLIRTKPFYLWIDAPDFDNPIRLREQFAESIRRYCQNYDAYFEKYASHAPSEVSRMDPFPRVLLAPGLGAICAGRDVASATIIRDIAAHTLSTKSKVAAMGLYCGLEEPDLFEMEYRVLQQTKLHRGSALPLEGHVALITGAAGAIGSGVAQELLEQGCHVAVTDLPGEPLRNLGSELSATFGQRVISVPIDITDAQSVADGFNAVARTWGGIDLLVLNAGAAHVSPLSEMSLDVFRRLEKINVEGTLLALAESARLFRVQGTGGDIVLISTKNVFAPGARFGAYSATKAAGHQLARIASQEFAEMDVRVNMVAPDAVFSHGARKSGLWAEVGPERMSARGLSPEGLEEYYRNRNLLKARITAQHVAKAVLFFATRQTPTTGATIPVDGGLPDSTPR